VGDVHVGGGHRRPRQHDHAVEDQGRRDPGEPGFVDQPGRDEREDRRPRPHRGGGERQDLEGGLAGQRGEHRVGLQEDTDHQAERSDDQDVDEEPGRPAQRAPVYDTVGHLVTPPRGYRPAGRRAS